MLPLPKHQYWKAEEQVAQRKVDAASVKAETKQLLIEAVDRRLVRRCAYWRFFERRY